MGLIDTSRPPFPPLPPYPPNRDPEEEMRRKMRADQVRQARIRTLLRRLRERDPGPWIPGLPPDDPGTDLGGG